MAEDGGAQAAGRGDESLGDTMHCGCQMRLKEVSDNLESRFLGWAGGFPGLPGVMSRGGRSSWRPSYGVRGDWSHFLWWLS